MTQINLGTHVKGDTFNPVTFTITETVDGVDTPMNLTGATAKMYFKTSPTGSAALELTTANGKLSITNATAGEIEIIKQIVSIDAGNYIFDLEITLQSGDVYTVAAGSLIIQQDISA
jgi:hypothetical protein